jgi:dolichol-phosphate mannosyltransferase
MALIGCCWALGVRLLGHHWVAGWTSLLLTVLFMGGVQLVCLGVVGEYVGRTYWETKKRPLYLVQEQLGLSLPRNATAPQTGEGRHVAARAADSSR